MTREKQLEYALRELLDYTVAILTGPLLSGLVVWPEGGPMESSPVLIRAKMALDRKD